MVQKRRRGKRSRTSRVSRVQKRSRVSRRGNRSRTSRVSRRGKRVRTSRKSRTSRVSRKKNRLRVVSRKGRGVLAGGNAARALEKFNQQVAANRMDLHALKERARELLIYDGTPFASRPDSDPRLKQELTSHIRKYLYAKVKEDEEARRTPNPKPKPKPPVRGRMSEDELYALQEKRRNERFKGTNLGQPPPSYRVSAGRPW